MSEKSVYEQGLTLLEYRARTVDELRRKLRQKGAPAEEIEKVLERLLDQKLLDDADFAKQFARGKLGSSGASRHRIAQELSRKGIKREAAATAIVEVTETRTVCVGVGAASGRVFPDEEHAARSRAASGWSRRIVAWV